MTVSYFSNNFAGAPPEGDISKNHEIATFAGETRTSPRQGTGMHLLREKLGQTAVGNPNEQHVVSLP